VKSESSHPSAREYVSGLAASGRHDFASRGVQSALGVSAAAAKLALNRLAKQKLIASPARGFYVIVPPEYFSLGRSKRLRLAKCAPVLLELKNQVRQ
jgi:N-acetylmuramic acid 6-phosphate (MurNAc-6-P) etherase